MHLMVLNISDSAGLFCPEHPSATALRCQDVISGTVHASNQDTGRVVLTELCLLVPSLKNQDTTHVSLHTTCHHCARRR